MTFCEQKQLMQIGYFETDSFRISFGPDFDRFSSFEQWQESWVQSICCSIKKNFSDHIDVYSNGME